MSKKHSISDFGFISCYGIAAKEFDFSGVNTSILSFVRKAYFQTGKQQKNNFVKKNDSAVYKYNFHLWKKGIKWVAYKNKSVYQNVVNQPDSRYYIQTFDDYGRIVRHDFFDEKHLWLKTTYYDNKGSGANLCSFVPYVIDNEPVILKYTTGNEEPTILFLCNAPQNDEQAELMREYEPLLDAEVLSDNGVLYFASEENKAEYLSALGKVKEQLQLKNAPKIYISEEDKKEGIKLRKEDFNLSKNLNETFRIDESEAFSQLQTPIDFLSDCQLQEPFVSSESIEEIVNDVQISDDLQNENEIYKKIEASEYFDEQKTADNADVFIEEIEQDKPKEAVSEAISAQTIAELAAEQINSAIYSGENNAEPSVDIQEPDAVIKSDSDSYYYYGNTDENGNRSGYGRTVMKNGFTAYDGMYENDMRNGFGCFYYKNGSFCYAGQWLDNKKNGLGVCRRDSDGVIQLGRWNEDKPVGISARADDKGNITYVGKYKNGKRDGIGVTFDENFNPVVALWKDGAVVELLYKNEENGEIDG